MEHYRFRYYSKNKKLLICFTSVLASALMVILFSLFMQIHMFEMKKEQNELLYGSWQGAVYDVSQESLAKVRGNEMVDTIGHMYVLGDVQNKELFVGSIGYVDSDFMEMANLELREGRFPKNKSEIAVEKMKLDQMGLDYTLGQKILIEIIQEEQVVEKEYVLTGIINNYSSTWLSRGRLISFFVAEDSLLDPIEQTLFFRVMEGYLESLEDLSFGAVESLVMNTHVEFSYDPFSSQNFPFTILAFFSIVYSILILMYIVRQWTQSHSRELVMLKSMGASMSMFICDFLRLIIKSFILPFVLFIGASLLLSIPFLLLWISLGIFFISLGVAVAGCMLRVNKIPVNINSFTQDMAIIHKRISVKYKKVTPLRMIFRSFRFHLKQELLQMGICILLLVFSYVTLTQTIQNYRNLELLEQQADIIVSYPTETYYSFSYFDETSKGHSGTRYFMPEIDNSVVSQFITNNVIQDYQLCMYDNRYYVEWEGIEDSPLFAQVDGVSHSGWVIEGWDQEDHIFPIVYSRDDSAYYDFLKTHIEEGKWDEKAFMNGEVIYIYLPEYTNEVYLDNQELNQYMESSNPNTFYDQERNYQDNTLKVGDTITFFEKDHPEKECKVGGIIREYYSSEKEAIPNNNCQIFVSKGFYGETQPINNIALYFDSDDNNEILESHFSAVASLNGMSFQNISQEKRIKREIIRNDLLLYGVIFIGILFVFGFTQMIFVSNKRRDTRYQHMVFHQLGISNKVYKKMWLIDMVLKVSGILLISFGLFVLIQYLEYMPEKRLMNPFSIRFSNTYWSWILFIVIDIIFIAIYNLCSLQIYKLDKKK